MKSKTITLLLTACINPNGMSFTALQDPRQRREQYIQALLFYLEKTDSKIVFVENTSTDLTYLFDTYIQEGRLEYITFAGNDYPKHFGKGYGECKILAYAIQNSKLIKESDYVVKITGRIIVTNITSITNSFFLKYCKQCLRVNLYSTNTISTVCFVCTPEWLSNYIIPQIDVLNDSKGMHMEHLFYQQIEKYPTSMRLFPFVVPPQIDGICGSTSKQYEVKSTLCNIADNTYLLSILLNKQNKKVSSLCLYILYYILIVIRKVQFLICENYQL